MLSSSVGVSPFSKIPSTACFAVPSTFAVNPWPRRHKREGIQHDTAGRGATRLRETEEGDATHFGLG